MLTISKRIWLVCAVVIALATTAGTASADSTPFTRGDAEAVFNAWDTGGNAVLLHSSSTEAPVTLINEKIDGFPADTHVCATDWHLIMFPLLVFGGESLTRSDAASILDSISMHWTLDGAPLETTRSQVKPYLRAEAFGFASGYGANDGTILDPDALSVGAHTVGFTAGPFGGPPPQTFYVDAAGTGACA
jgi:hypothetical protein